MNVLRAPLFLAIVVAAMATGLLWSVESRAAQTPPPSGSIVGVWTLNKDLSDPPRSEGQREGDDGRRGHRGGGQGGGGFGRGGGMGRGGMGGGSGRGGSAMSPEDAQRMRDALRDVLNAPDRLTVVDTGTMILMTASDGRVTRLSPDGKKIKDDNTKIQRKTRWEDGKLVSEITGLGPGKITETYSVEAAHHQLLVTLVMEDPRMPQPRTEHRVYDAEAR